MKNHNSNGKFKKGNQAAKKKDLKTILVNDAHTKKLPVEKKETDIEKRLHCGRHFRRPNPENRHNDRVVTKAGRCIRFRSDINE